MNNKKKLIIGIVLGIILISGITYAILTWTSTRINLGITSDCFTIDYTKGGDITGSLKLLNEEDLITSDNKFTIKNGVGISSANIGINSSCNIEGYGSLYLNVTSISDAFTTGSSVGSLKYAVLKNTSSITNPREVTVTSLLNQSFDIEAKGSITSSGTKDILVRNLSNTEIYKYLIVIYIDNNLAGNDVIGATFEANISADATQGKAPYKGLAKLIANDTFTPNTTVTNNEITYNYDTTHSLMEDVGGNIRYYGKSKFVGTVPAWQSDDTKSRFGNFDSEESCLATMAYFNICSPDLSGYENYGYSDQATCEAEYDWGSDMFGESMTYNEGKEKYCTGTENKYELVDPNNYIYFNCSDYSNQSSSTCETWRIIGVFEGKVKIMRGSTIGSYSWDNKNTSTGAEDNYGKNDWTDARLMKLLNPGYEGETTGGSLYYNSGSGSCYSDENNATRSCDFTSTGIKNDTTRNLISDTLYYLGGWDNESVYSDTIYEKERGTTVYSGRPTTWTGKIALPYPSDYGYAVDLGSCTVQLASYNDSTCINANWMKPIFTSSINWLLTPSTGSSYIAWDVYSSGNVRGISNTFYANGVVPVLYLGSELGIRSGTGTNSDPYRLSVS